MYCEDKPLSKINLVEWIGKVNAVAKNPTIVLVENSRSLNEDAFKKLPEDMDAFCKNYGIKLHYRISADSQQQVDETFQRIARAVHTRDFESTKEKEFITGSYEEFEHLDEYEEHLPDSDSSIVLGNKGFEKPNNSSCCARRRSSS